MSTPVHSRGVGDQNWVKIGPRSRWMAPKYFLESLKITLLILSCMKHEVGKYDAPNKNYRNENLFISGIKYILNWVVCSSLVSSQLTWGSFRLKIEITRKTKQKVAKESIGKEEQSYWILIFHDNGFWSPLIYFFFNRVKCEIIFFLFSKTNI